MPHWHRAAEYSVLIASDNEQRTTDTGTNDPPVSRFSRGAIKAYIHARRQLCIIVRNPDKTRIVVPSDQKGQTRLKSNCILISKHNAVGMEK